MKMKKILIWALSAFVLSSCADEFLQRDPLGLESNVTFYKDKANCEEGVNSIYDPAQWLNMYSRNFWGIGDVCSDDSEKGGENEKDQPSMQELQTFSVNSSNAYLVQMWRGYYVGIARANDMLNSTESGEVDFDQKDLLRYRAEARFLRALYYFDLTRIFGAVPLIVKPLSPGEGANVGNRDFGTTVDSQRDSVLGFVCAELEAIKADLPWSYGASDIGRATRGAAMGLLTRAYVYKKNWSSALATAESLMASPEMPYGQLSVNYQDIFTLLNENNPEILFSIQFVDAENGLSYDRAGEGSEKPTYMNVRTVYCLDNKSNKFLSARGYGFNTPRADLIKTFDAKDPRLDMIYKKGDSIWWFFNDVPNAVLQKHPVAFPSLHTGYYCKKGTLDYDQFSKAQPQSSPLDIPLIRLAEVYLLAAEAAFNTGDVAKATKYVNAVRTRARNSARKENGFRDYTYGVASSVPADLGTVTLDDIYNERRRELFCEGHRFFDLVRTGKIVEAIAGKKTDSFGSSVEFTEGKNEIFPIPNVEILRHSGGLLIQNPGY